MWWNESQIFIFFSLINIFSQTLCRVNEWAHANKQIYWWSLEFVVSESKDPRKKKMRPEKKNSRSFTAPLDSISSRKKIVFWDKFRLKIFSTNKSLGQCYKYPHFPPQQSLFCCFFFSPEQTKAVWRHWLEEPIWARAVISVRQGGSRLHTQEIWGVYWLLRTNSALIFLHLPVWALKHVELAQEGAGRRCWSFQGRCISWRPRELKRFLSAFQWLAFSRSFTNPRPQDFHLLYYSTV